MNKELKKWVEGSIEIIKKAKEIGKPDEWIKKHFKPHIKDEKVYYEIASIVGKDRQLLKYAIFMKNEEYELGKYLLDLVLTKKMNEDFIYMLKFLMHGRPEFTTKELFPRLKEFLQRRSSEISISQLYVILFSFLYLAFKNLNNKKSELENFVKGGTIFNLLNTVRGKTSQNDTISLRIIALCIIGIIWIGRKNLQGFPSYPPLNHGFRFYSGDLFKTFATTHNFWDILTEEISKLELFPRLLCEFRSRKKIEPDHSILLYALERALKYEKYYEDLAENVLDGYLLIEEAAEEKMENRLKKFIEWCLNNEEIFRKYIIGINFLPENPNHRAFILKVMEIKKNRIPKEMKEWIEEGFAALTQKDWKELLEDNEKEKEIREIILKIKNIRLGNKFKKVLQNMITKRMPSPGDYSPYLEVLPEKEKEPLIQTLWKELKKKFEQKRYSKTGEFLKYYGKYFMDPSFIQGNEDWLLNKVAMCFLKRSKPDIEEIKWLKEILEKCPSIIEKAKKESIDRLRKMIEEKMNKKKYTPLKEELSAIKSLLEGGKHGQENSRVEKI